VSVDNARTAAADDAAPAAAGLDGLERSQGDIRERALAGPSAAVMLPLHVVLLIIGIVLVSDGGVGRRWGEVVGGGVLIILAIVVVVGLVTVSPGEAQVVQLFGRYIGTIRGGGMYWVNPSSKRKKISTRVRSHQTEVAKVNDADGNPIEIAAAVVWQVEDTAKAVFAVEDLPGFVALQAETTVRQIASWYPYDDHGQGVPSLRGATEDATARLAAKLAQRVAPAGVKIIEARLVRLAYAQEIAHAMLRRQQAVAMVAARQKIVDGAVGMVEQALARLDADGLIELDPERKAAMVSNMLVVLCSDHPTQPVINTGTLYQ
jgi:regulator of protease activity HflC (stomatin/prohibitin superfamily)